MKFQDLSLENFLTLATKNPLVFKKRKKKKKYFFTMVLHILWTKKEPNDQVYELRLSKSLDELFSSRLKGKKLFSLTVHHFPTTTGIESTFVFFLWREGHSVLWCADISHLLHKFGVPQYTPKVWKLVVDSREQLVKCFLLHKGNRFASGTPRSLDYTE